jgi:hypothetical protein
LPSKFDVHEWDIMRRFSESIDDDEIRNELLRAIHGSGAFRYFKDSVCRRDLRDRWFKFRDEALEQIAIEWCKENGIEYENRRRLTPP